MTYTDDVISELQETISEQADKISDLEANLTYARRGAETLRMEAEACIQTAARWEQAHHDERALTDAAQARATAAEAALAEQANKISDMRRLLTMARDQCLKVAHAERARADAAQARAEAAEAALEPAPSRDWVTTTTIGGGTTTEQPEKRRKWAVRLFGEPVTERDLATIDTLVAIADDWNTDAVAEATAAKIAGALQAAAEVAPTVQRLTVERDEAFAAVKRYEAEWCPKQDETIAGLEAEVDRLRKGAEVLATKWMPASDKVPDSQIPEWGQGYRRGQLLAAYELRALVAPVDGSGS